MKDKFESFDGTNQCFAENQFLTVEQKAENFIRNHPDFPTEGMSDYQNGLFNGYIEGFNAAKKEQL